MFINAIQRSTVLEVLGWGDELDKHVAVKTIWEHGLTNECGDIGQVRTDVPSMVTNMGTVRDSVKNLKMRLKLPFSEDRIIVQEASSSFPSTTSIDIFILRLPPHPFGVAGPCSSPD
ncbi:Protein CBG27051 [Caenorhabditis briggsae]|uniref:Protein CBG27051 n=1 Tax=Caenorhabditis briggsae TaxID=6238 RepID=B6IMB5_CAEBR|nr:Protein CBG27051 [Caenorhabditis briggsae]CAS01045.1 Protein CBG27051 [Caenorhabditis briggsae]